MRISRSRQEYVAQGFTRFGPITEDRASELSGAELIRLQILAFKPSRLTRQTSSVIRKMPLPNLALPELASSPGKRRSVQLTTGPAVSEGRLCAGYHLGSEAPRHVRARLQPVVRSDLGDRREVSWSDEARDSRSWKNGAAGRQIDQYPKLAKGHRKARALVVKSFFKFSWVGWRDS